MNTLYITYIIDETDVCDFCDMALFNAYQICIKCGVSACMDCDMNSDACDNDTEKGHLIQPCVVHSSASGKIYFQFFARFTNTKRKFHTFYNKHLNFIYYQMLKQPSFEKKCHCKQENNYFKKLSAPLFLSKHLETLYVNTPYLNFCSKSGPPNGRRSNCCISKTKPCFNFHPTF